MKLSLVLLLSVACSSEPTTDVRLSAIEGSRALATVGAGGDVAASFAYEEASLQRLTVPQRLFVGSDLTDPGNDPTLEVVTRGVMLQGHDGGVQSFNQSTYDSSIDKTYQSFALAGFNEASCVGGGPGRCRNIAVGAAAHGGDENFSFFGTQGQFRNNEGGAMGIPFTFGDGPPTTAMEVLFHSDVKVENGRAARLGTDVGNFMMPGLDGAEPQLGIGMSGGYAQQLLVKNVHQGGAGALLFADTNVAAGAHSGVSMYRGTAATPSNWRAGFNVGAGGNQFAVGDTENALVVWSYDATDASYGIELATGSAPTVRLRVRADGRVEILSGLAAAGPVGFYGAAPIAKQTGVPVTCAGVHTALVNLGLIAN